MKKEKQEPAVEPADNPAAPAPAVPLDPLASLKSRVTGNVIGFVKNHPWKAAAMIAAAGLAFVLCGGNKAKTA